MGDARRRAEEALRMFDQTATPEPHEVYLYRAIAALREILAEEDERGAEPRECLCRCPETPGTHTATRCWDPAPPAPEITRHPCGCVDDGRPHGTLGHHNGHVICDSCGVCKDCDLPTPTEIRKDYLALHRFASALRWAVAQGAQGRRSDRLDLPPLLASVFDSIIAVLTRSQAASVAPAPSPAADEVREAAFARFGRALLPKWWDDGNPGDIDGGDAQEAAEACGLWHRVERHADGVECEWCNNEEPCGELTEAGLAALAARGGAE